MAKWPHDREALLQAAISGSPKFFLGTDSAPHDIKAKTGQTTGKTSAGVFTQPYATSYILDALELAIERKIISESDVTAEILENFLGGHGRRFYGIGDSSGERIILRKGSEVVEKSFAGKEGIQIVPFRRGQSTWSVEWK